MHVSDLRAAWSFVNLTLEGLRNPATRSSVGMGVLSWTASTPLDADERIWSGPFPALHSPTRTRALALCGWSVEADSHTPSVSALCDRCASQGRWERGAALATFHGDLSRAVELLEQAAAQRAQETERVSLARDHLRDLPMVPGTGVAMQQLKRASELIQGEREVLQMTAMAVAGFPGPGAAVAKEEATGPPPQGLWCSLCRRLMDVMGRRHPYLRSVCAFLLAQAETVPPHDTEGVDGGDPDWRSSPWLPVLAERGVRLSDRVAFAALFLPAAAWRGYVEALVARSEREGQVDALLLTGLGDRGVNLLQAYVDRTGDVQTAALVACFVPPSRVRRAAARRLVLWIQR